MFRIIHLLLIDKRTFAGVAAGKVEFPRLDGVIDRQRGRPSRPEIIRDGAGKFDKYVVLIAFRMLVDMHLCPVSNRSCNRVEDDSHDVFTNPLMKVFPLSMDETTKNYIEENIPHYDSLLLMYLSEMAVWDTFVQQFISLPFVTQQELDLEDAGRELVWEPFFTFTYQQSTNDKTYFVMSMTSSLILMKNDSLPDDIKQSHCDWCGVSVGSMSRCGRCQSAYYCR